MSTIVASVLSSAPASEPGVQGGDLVGLGLGKCAVSFADTIKDDATNIILFEGRGHPGKVCFNGIERDASFNIVDAAFHDDIIGFSGKGDGAAAVAGVGEVANGVAEETGPDLVRGLATHPDRTIEIR